VPASAVLPEPWSDLGIPEDEGKRCPKNWRSPKRAIVKLADFRHAKFLSLDSQYSFGYEQWLRGLCERLGGFEPDIAAVGNSADSLQVLRDVAQNVAFAGSILARRYCSIPGSAGRKRDPQMKGDAIATPELIEAALILSRNAGKTLGSAGTKPGIGHKQNVNFEPKEICYKRYTKGLDVAASSGVGLGRFF
jgi:hypothetical protein